MTANYLEPNGEAAALRKKAEDALAVAETMKDPQARQSMRWLAAAYKRLADAMQTELEASVEGDHLGPEVAKPRPARRL